jgi:DNA invertase Pin-like site-specific DNA recombinase
LSDDTAKRGAPRKNRVQSVSKIVVYRRVSTDEQAESGLGLEAQLAACRTAAIRLGREIAFTFQDDASGGLPLDKRPVLVDAIASLGRGDTLLVAKRDRLSRGDPLVTGMIEAAVERAGARVVSAAGEGTDSDEPSAILMRRIVDAFGEYERLLIKARTKAALRAKRARGERTGQVPYGHHLAADGRTLEPDAAEAAAIGLVHELRAARMSLRAIARELDRRGILTKSGRPWRHTTIRDLLEQPADANEQ